MENRVGVRELDGGTNWYYDEVRTEPYSVLIEHARDRWFGSELGVSFALWLEDYDHAFEFVDGLCFMSWGRAWGDRRRRSTQVIDNGRQSLLGQAARNYGMSLHL